MTSALQILCAAVGIALLAVPASVLVYMLTRGRRVAAMKCGTSNEWQRVRRGRMLVESPFGGANVNGAECRGEVNVTVFEHGVVVRLKPRFATGAIWMPIEHLQVTPCPAAGFWGGTGHCLTDGRHRVVLSAPLSNTPGLVSAIEWAIREALRK